MTQTFCICSVLSQISLVMFMIENSPKIFGEDLVSKWFETSLIHPPDEKSSLSQNVPINIGTLKDIKHEPSVEIYTIFSNISETLLRSPTAPLPCEAIRGVYNCFTTIINVRIIEH